MRPGQGSQVPHVPGCPGWCTSGVWPEPTVSDATLMALKLLRGTFFPLWNAEHQGPKTSPSPAGGGNGPQVKLKLKRGASTEG